MNSVNHIVKNADLPVCKNYYALRDIAIQWIQQYCRKTWTDHNAHDPGITILEVLCFALADLGYKSEFPIEDLLTRKDAANNQMSDFIPADEVLSSAPLTLKDYRKLLVRIQGIRNAEVITVTSAAELKKMTGLEIFADCMQDRLSFTQPDCDQESGCRVSVKGFFRILLELELDPLFGSLNSRDLTYRFSDGPLIGVVVTLKAPRWKLNNKHIKALRIEKTKGRDLSYLARSIQKKKNIAFSNEEILKFSRVTSTDFPSFLERIHSQYQYNIGFDELVRLQEVPEKDLWYLHVQVTEDGGKVLQEYIDIIVVEDKPRFDRPPVDITPGKLMQYANVLTRLFSEKHAKIDEIIENASKVFHAYRNICEDLISIDIIDSVKIAFCADIDVKPHADVEKVQAQIYELIERYLNPALPFYSLDDLLKKGVPVESIYDGPHPKLITESFPSIPLKPGFVLDEDLERSCLRNTILASDIINQIMKIEGVIAVRNFIMNPYNEYERPGKGKRWMLEIQKGIQPVLNEVDSKFIFYKNDIPFRAERGEFERTLNYLREVNLRQSSVSDITELPFEKGRYRHLDNYRTIINEFPENYDIGLNISPRDTADNNTIKARQLEAYLTIFDQMLADLQGQLIHLKEILSTDGNAIGNTYYSIPLNEKAGLLPDFSTQLHIKGEVDLDKMEDRLSLIETEEVRLSRQNQFLDHLLARFNEKFDDYVFLGNDLWEHNERDCTIKPRDLAELIQDKIRFLRDYKEISRFRGSGFNYLDEKELWDTGNVAGLKKRISRVLGIDDFSRRDLSCNFVWESFTAISSGPSYRWKIRYKDPAQSLREEVYFVSSTSFPDQEGALLNLQDVFPYLRMPWAVEIEEQHHKKYKIIIKDETGTVLAKCQKSYQHYQEALNTVRGMWHTYDHLLECNKCDVEGYYLIEHLLLLPADMTDESTLMNVCLDSECEFDGNKDPYSFRISVFLPYWPKRFRRREFRTYVEQSIREETPAHIHAKICWIGNGQMILLERAYKKWINLLKEKYSEPSNYQECLKEMIKVINLMITQYPEANLHDCEDDLSDFPVQLGRTNLGTF